MKALKKLLSSLSQALLVLGFSLVMVVVYCTLMAVPFGVMYLIVQLIRSAFY